MSKSIDLPLGQLKAFVRKFGVKAAAAKYGVSRVLIYRKYPSVKGISKQRGKRSTAKITKGK